MLFRLRKLRPTLAERAAPRASPHATRLVRCYACARAFEASAHAESCGCPGCGRALRLPDVVVRDGHWGGSIQTAGVVRVLPGCTVRASLILASGDVLIEGAVHAMIVSGGTVRITSTGSLHGGARCATLAVEPGAVVSGGPFESPSDAIGTIDIDLAMRSRPGRGPAARVDALADSQAEPKPVPIARPKPPSDSTEVIVRPPDAPRLRVVR